MNAGLTSIETWIQTHGRWSYAARQGGSAQHPGCPAQHKGCTTPAEIRSSDRQTAGFAGGQSLASPVAFELED